MAGADATLLLQAIGLARQATGDGLVFEASGALHQDGSPLPTAAALKLGQGATIAPELKALFPTAQDPPAGETALWFTLPASGAPAAGRPAWLGIFGRNDVQLHASVPLATGAVTLPGLLNFGADLRLTADIVVHGSAIASAHFRIAGSATLVAALGPLEPAGLHVNSVVLDLQVHDLPELGSIVDDPAALLDGAFAGTLSVDASASGLTLGSVMVGGGSATLNLAVSSTAGSRELTLDAVDFALRSSAPLTLLGSATHLAGLTVSGVELTGALTGTGWHDLRLHGAGTVTLPTLLSSALDHDAAAPGAQLSASLDLHHWTDAQGAHTAIDADVHGLRLTPSDALFSLPVADVRTALRSDGGIWELRVTGEAFVGWHELAARLASVGAAEVPPASSMPDVHAVTTLALDHSGASGTASVAFDLRRPGGAREPYAGGLGPLPFEVAGLALTASASFDAQGVGAWSISGGGRLSTVGALRQVARLDGATFALDAHGDGTSTPRLRFRVAGGLPPLRLPSFDGGTIDILTLQSLDLELGEELEVSGTLAVARPQPQALAARLGLPTALQALLEKLGRALPDTGTFDVRIPLEEGGAAPTIDVVLRPSNPPTFRLLTELGQLFGGQPAGTTQATRVAGLTVPQDFFSVAPRELRFTASLDEKPTIHFSGGLDCVVLGERFDTTLRIGVADGKFDIALMAGLEDPIRITIPMPDARRMLGSADPQAIANAYGLNAAQRQALVLLKQQLDQLATELAAQGAFAFEISDFGLRVTPDGPTLSGDVRLVQLPRMLEALTPLTRLKLGLGAETDKLFIDIELADGDTQPLLTVPVPGDVDVAVYLGRFMFAYAWGHDEFAFALDARVLPSKTLNVTAGGSGVYLPAAKADVQLGATATAPPVPIPEGIFSFKRPTRAAGDKAVDDLGLQAVIGSGQSRYVTAYLRELAFSPTYFLIWPGVRADFGLVLGGPNPRTLATADDYLNVRANWDRSAFFARFTIKNGTVIFMDPSIGFLLNPLAFVPPFLTANPPYWIEPPMLLGDVYADELGISANIPGLAFFDLTFERPMPGFSLQALLEFAALAAGGFSQKIPATSPLRKVFYAKLSFLLEVSVAGLSPTKSSFGETIEVNVADLINGVLDVAHKARATLDAGSDLVHAIESDPSLLIRMIPADKRRLQHQLDLAGFRFSGSVQLLTPEELRDELVLFFESKRRKPRGLAANQTPPDPAPAPVVNTTPQLSAVRQITRTVVEDVRSLAPRADFLASIAVPAALKSRDARAARIDAIKADREANVSEMADALTTALLKAGDAPARKQLLDGPGLGAVAAEIEKALAVRGPRIDTRGQRTRVRAIVAEAIAATAEVIVAKPGLAAAPEELASALVERTVSRPAPTAVRPGLAPVLETAATAEAASAGVATALGGLQRSLAGPATARRSATAAATKEIAAALTAKYEVRREPIGVLDAIKGDPAALTTSVTASAKAAWRGRERVRARVDSVDVFDAQHFAHEFGRVDLAVFAPPTDPADTVEVVTGYAITNRDGSGSVSIPVPSAAAQYKVERGAGRFRVLVRRSDGTWQAHVLPGPFVASVPEGLGKADALRDRLAVKPLITRRARTAAEKAAVAEQWETSPTLYQASVFARPEYQLKPTGGVHGPLSIADLLRSPGTGAYTIPNAPALLAGFTASLFGQDVALAGIVLPAQPTASALLYGHSSLDVGFGALAVHAEGDFVASAGPAWQSVPLPSGAVTAANAIGFNGTVKLTQNGATLLDGGASGEFTRDASGRSRAKLKAHVASQGTNDIGVGDTKFARISWSLDGDVEVALSSQPSLSITVQTAARVTVDLATYAIRTVVDIPEQTVCVPWLYGDPFDPRTWHWGSKCTTTPAVTHPEIDFNTVSWSTLATASCAVDASVTNAGVSFSLDLSALPAGVRNTIGVSSIALPNVL